MSDTGTELRPAVVAYFENRPLTLRQVNLIRLYLKQRIDAPVWAGGEDLDELRREVNQIRTASDISAWLRKAEDADIKPL
jgi:hypothetical protein